MSHISIALFILSTILFSSFWASPSLASMQPEIFLKAGSFALDGIEGPAFIENKLCASNFSRIGLVGCIDTSTKGSSVSESIDLSARSKKINGMAYDELQKNLYILDEQGFQLFEVKYRNAQFQSPLKLSDINVKGYGPNDLALVGSSIFITVPIWSSSPAHGALVKYDSSSGLWTNLKEWSDGEINGIAWDSKTGFVYLSHHDKVLRFKANSKNEIAESEIYFEAHDKCTYMDGLKVTAQGEVYVACFAQNRILKISGDRSAEYIELEPISGKDAHPTNLALANNGDIYITVRNSKTADIILIRHAAAVMQK